MSVYFIRPIGMQGPIKIGSSFSPSRRCGVLETWSPFPLEVAAELPGGYQLERRFHALFAGQHQHREWFLWSPQLESVLQAIRGGSFDISTLPPPRKIWTKCNQRPRTLGERYSASVKARLDVLRGRGMQWSEVGRPDVMYLRSLAGAELDAARERTEAFFERVAARFPKPVKQAEAA